MAEKKKVTCTVEFTDGAIDRITQILVDYYYAIRDGVYTDIRKKDKTA